VQKSKRIRNFRALAKVEAYLNKVGTSERTKAVIEPRLSDQWFLKMEDLVKPAKAFGEVKLHPKRFEIPTHIG
jgi:valyl-tRNA synthetase